MEDKCNRNVHMITNKDIIITEYMYRRYLIFQLHDILKFFQKGLENASHMQL